MSRELVLMQAQCPSEISLNEVGNKEVLSRTQKGCYDAYLNARSLILLSQFRIAHQPEVRDDEWLDLWISLEDSLKTAGKTAYYPKRVSDHWRAIIEKSEQP